MAFSAAEAGKEGAVHDRGHGGGGGVSGGRAAATCGGRGRRQCAKQKRQGNVLGAATAAKRIGCSVQVAGGEGSEDLWRALESFHCCSIVTHQAFGVKH